ncbi:uncharacterized protein OCT59_012500 [Rhizophagus irregularis]|jgi:hypothetical protein|uniref:C2H2-type domain-containing protein n=1 Tax=Rhizophagus irregularis (strain DAOM 181602 / DAOM 197198 / MUCL 43194) TaxID=747089 RepID=A0A2P4NZW1_RHIID|nr:hypothetical protein GLOIN_2v1728872 [Rhizophagus irregularis DAOM 181602=DAOM 197198]POG58663.1 hypothetical protein GLOIN_2v1728872 [Rhizophagus irregularis DAOM 181602=DAOM 197198]UZO01399.1 hypothetical protein OCT59_012500 [Rhizophagus irregularis]GBC40482.2 hypothetical protein GLOIN_2v1728872 [Rhizophagus irregularis DAOM 181602=DAOM 197198]|eukprot:XP_025165529.1 hypothetical protein GLOIN_2v1728872 [Rhizophagus irregularis DAOM 181602=DAOM 197198]
MSTQDSTKLYCSICKRRAKGFKNRSGLQRHETLKHVSYNTLPSHVRSVPNSELSHLKKAIIKELQKRLKNHHTAVGKQVFSIHCSEDAFVSIFKNHITRYSPCGSSYFCSFKGEKAFEEVGKILDDENWGERNYGGGQLSFVRLHMPEVENSNYEQSAKKSKTKSLVNGEMTVQWKVTGGKDKENHKFEAGSAQFRFFLDQCQI